MLALLSAPDVDAFGWTEGEVVLAFAMVQHGPERALACVRLSMARVIGQVEMCLELL